MIVLLFVVLYFNFVHCRGSCVGAGPLDTSVDRWIDFRVSVRHRATRQRHVQHLLRQQQLVDRDTLRDMVCDPHDIDATLRWLKSAFAEHSQTTIEFLSLDAFQVRAAPTSVVEALFGVPLAHYRCWSDRTFVRFNQTALATLQLPEFVDIVHDLQFLPVQPKRVGGVRGSVGYPGQNVTPQLLRSLYGIDYYAQSSKAAVSVAEFEQAYFYPVDLAQFQQNYKFPANPIAKIVGPNHPQSGYLGEASLDVEYVTTTGWNMTTWVFSVANNGFDLLAWSDLVLNTPNSPLVHSISWGSGESNFVGQHARVDAMFQHLAALGHTVLVASGDDSTGHTGLVCGTFDPNFPASSPHVTAVGGLYQTQTGSAQTLWSLSGGGVSAVFARPSWQDAAYNHWESAYGKSAPDSSYWNNTGRALPDVAALATNYQVFISNSTGELSGTSAATPVLAAMVALINDFRLNANKPPLGLLNPRLYQQCSKCFTDIVDGQQEAVAWCPKGFKAELGYDVASGLGAPIFSKLFATLSQ